MRNTLGVLLLVMVTAGPAGAAFEDIEISPRNRALGMANVAMELDAWAVYHNPAALAWAAEPRAAAAYVKPFGYGFSSQSAVAANLSIGKFGGLGAAFRHFGVDHEGENLTQETTVSLSHGLKLLEDIQSTVAVGWALNLYSLDYGTSVGGVDPGSATGVGLDIGAQAVIQERTRVGFQALNVNNPRIGDFDKEELIRRVVAGVSYAPYRGVTTLLDISFTQGEQAQYRGGTEFEIAEYFLLRGGIRTAPTILTFGAGFRWRGLNLDYGFSSGGGVLAATHQFGIEYVFPEKRD